MLPLYSSDSIVNMVKLSGNIRLGSLAVIRWLIICYKANLDEGLLRGDLLLGFVKSYLWSTVVIIIVIYKFADVGTVFRTVRVTGFSQSSFGPLNVMMWSSASQQEYSQLAGSGSDGQECL